MLPESITAVTEPIDGRSPLLHLLSGEEPLAWVRRGEGMIGIGTALRLEFAGADRITAAAEQWRALVARAETVDPVQAPGTGLVAFGAFSFGADSALPSVLIVPRVVVGRVGDRGWVTRIAVDGAPLPEAPSGERPLGAEYRAAFQPGALDKEGYRAAVQAAVGEIHDHRLAKVVLARELTARLPQGADLRLALDALALGYPDCWTYAVDGLIGSSPETLIRVDHGRLSARVLAGSIGRGADAAADHDAAIRLATSAKDQDEHQYAVHSVIAALGGHASRLSVSDLPFTLKLPNLWHLASDLEGVLGDGSSSLDLIAALHPTAAVAGTPRTEALALIDRLEPFDRGRYAGPVGWVDAAGDGEWAVALRGAQLGPDGTLTAYAGCGIVADSDPERELAETSMKFRPIVEAFG